MKYFLLVALLGSGALHAGEEPAVSIYEWSVAGDRSGFEARNANNDQRLDVRELAAAPARTKEESAARDSDRRIQMMSDNLSGDVDFTEYDTDGNGLLDRGEASDDPYVLQYFDAWDSDDNQLLDASEVKDGRIDVDEY